MFGYELSFSKDAVFESKVMKLEGKLNGSPILVLIDSGASHNFVSRKVIHALNLPIHDTQGIGIRLGDGHRVVTKGKCTLEVDLGSIIITVTAFVLDIGSLDLIFRVSWLETLGVVQADWSRLSMTFRKGTELITLQGIHPKPLQHAASLQSLVGSKVYDMDGLFWSMEVHCSKSDQSGDLSRVHISELQQVLNQFPTVFSDIQDLPPSSAK